MKNKVVVVDLDDTLSNTEKRKHLLNPLIELKEKKQNASTKEEKDILNTLQEKIWNEFNKKCIEDLPITENIEKIKKYQEQGFKIFAFSGRFDFMRTETVDYFKNIGIEFDLLKLRQPFQKMKTEYLKNSWLRKYVYEQGLELVEFIDDNKTLIDYLKEKNPQDYDKFKLYEPKRFEFTEEMDNKIENVISNLFNNVYFCTRVQSAWSYGTMTSNDFCFVNENKDYISEIVSLAKAVLKHGNITEDVLNGIIEENSSDMYYNECNIEERFNQNDFSHIVSNSLDISDAVAKLNAIKNTVVIENKAKVAKKPKV